jgi:hypothetical protein
MAVAVESRSDPPVLRGDWLLVGFAHRRLGGLRIGFLVRRHFGLDRGCLWQLCLA